MISKAKLKELAAFKQQKQCQENDCFVIEGVKMVAEALDAHIDIIAVCATATWIESHEVPSGIELHEVAEPELLRLSNMATPNEVWALAKRCYPEVPTAQRLTLALDRIQDPGNMGTIIRIADWFGIRQIVCSPDTASCFNPKVVQSTMGGIFRTSIRYTPLADYLAGQDIPIYGAMLNGDNLYSSTLATPAILVVGNESRGISHEVAARLTHRLLIPNYGGTCESLNAAVATSILCAEFFRTL